MSFKPFDVMGRPKGESNMTNNAGDNSLFNVLKGTGNIILRPDLFPEVTVNKSGTITMKSRRFISMDLGHKNRFFIPFTNSDVFISDFYNGVFEVYPSYRLLVVENTGFREFSGASVFGIYDMTSQIYETVNLNDKWEEIPAAELERRRRTGEVIVERKSPFSIAITPAMTEYFNALKANEIKKSFDF